MVGFSAEQYVGFLIDKKKAPNISRIVRDNVEAVKGHPALLCYEIGNEIAGSVAHWLERSVTYLMTDRDARVSAMTSSIVAAFAGPLRILAQSVRV
jgi:hypothetical protein